MLRPHIHEVGRRSACIFDDVHGGHGQAGTVDDIAHIAVQINVIEIIFRGFHLHGVFLVQIPQSQQILVPEQALESKSTLASKAMTFPSEVKINGLISTRDMSCFTKNDTD